MTVAEIVGWFLYAAATEHDRYSGGVCLGYERNRLRTHLHWRAHH